MKTILGLDIGTNSIGGALIKLDLENYGDKGEIIWLGSRIIPIDGDALQKFESGGQVETKAAARRQKRMSRRLKHRYKLRRTRLIKVFKVLGWVDEDFPEDFKKLINNNPLFKFNIGRYLPFQEEIIIEALKELLGKQQTEEILAKGGGKIPIKKNGKIDIPISEDWIIYYLRKKALSEKVSLQELARIIYMMNQRRGFKSSRKDLKDTTILDYEDFKEMVDEEKYTDENGNTIETQFVEITKIKTVEQTEEDKDKNGNYTFKIFPESTRMKPWEEKRKKKPEWEGNEYNFLVTQKTKKKGEIEQLKPQIPDEKDWSLAMVALDNEFKDRHPGEFFFDKLKENKNYRIRQQVVQRKRYQAELRAIWNKQAEFYPELNQKEKLKEIAHILYPTQSENELSKWKEITNGMLYDLIANDIIYYQRDLKSQKNLIDECRYEKKTPFKNKEGKEITVGYKVAPKSCPEFQEFRIWQDVHNINIIEKEKEVNGKVQFDVNVTSEFINNQEKAELFDMFDSKSELKEADILKYFDIKPKARTHKINLFANREFLKGNETKTIFRNIFRKYGYDGDVLLNDKTKLRLLWHILYSLNGKNAETGIRNALKNKKNEFNLPEEVIEHFAAKTKEFDKKYASYSLKAINKLLPLMRCGKYWSESNIHPETRRRINKFIDGEYDEYIDDSAREKIKLCGLDSIEKFQGLPVWLACYVAYGRYSERENNDKYENFIDIDVTQLIPTNSLRNPIVEQVIRETLHIVKDVWEKYERPDYIHIEMAHDFKHTQEERKNIATAQNKNYEEKQRAKKLLQELKLGNPNSPVDIDKFRIWLNNGGREGNEKFNELFDKKGNVTQSEIQKYLLWAEQGHKSPYTGEQIPLSKLFTDEYEVEHIIPRSKLKYDAFQNFVICERAVNGFKDKRLARIMIDEDGGREHNYKGQKFKLLSFKDYKPHCTATFSGRKLKNLLALEIPEDFIERQINDTRHITRKLNELLWPIAKEKEGLIFTIGSITNELKKQWEFNNIWKELLKSRFERLEGILEQSLIIPVKNDPKKYNYQLPDDKVKLKRIDHRHHAMDALIVAATSRAHIKYLNSLHSHKELEKWKYLANKGIRDFILPWPEFTKDSKEQLRQVIISYKANNRVLSTPHNRYWKWEQQPDGNWKKVLKKQKQNERWKAVKKSMFLEPCGQIYLKEIKEVSIKNAIQIQLEREKGTKDNLGKPRDYIYDKVLREKIRKICNENQGDIEKIKKEASKFKDKEGNKIKTVSVAIFNEFASKRVAIDKSFTEKKIKDSIPYATRTIKRWEYWQEKGEIIKYKNGIPKKEKFPLDTKKWPLAFLLIKHLEEYDLNPNDAFQGEGLELLNKKAAKPITKLTRFEKKSNPIKFQGKILETDTGGNVFFIIYKNIETGEHKEMYSIPLYSSEDVKDLKEYGAINRLINQMPIADERAGYKIIILKPGELVYVPTLEELETPNFIDQINWNGIDKSKVFERIYKMVSCTGSKCLFVPHFIAQSLDKEGAELGASNKNERAWDGKVEYKLNKKGKEIRTDTGTMIKNVCIPIKLNRLGDIIEVGNKKIYN